MRIISLNSRNDQYNIITPANTVIVPTEENPTSSRTNSLNNGNASIPSNNGISIYSRKIEDSSSFDICDTIMSIFKGVGNIFYAVCTFIGANLRFSENPVLYIASELDAKGDKEQEEINNNLNFFLGFGWLILKLLEASQSIEKQEQES